MTIYTDDFNRADTPAGSGLGTIPGGPAWETINGSWRILSNRAYTSTSRSLNPISAITTPTGDADVRCTTSSNGGDAVYARVTDEDNWIRVRVRRFTTTTSFYITEYEWARGYQHGYPTDCGQTHTGALVNAFSGTTQIATKWSTSNTTAPSFSQCEFGWFHAHLTSDGNSTWGSHNHGYRLVGGTYLTGETRQTQVSSTSTHRRAILEQCVNGTVSQLGITTASPSSLRLLAVGTSLQVFVNGSTSASISATSSAHINVNKHGIGRATSDLDGQSLDNFYIDTLNSPPNTPTLLSPIDNASINLEQSQTFKWQFNDPDSGDTQSRSRGEVLNSESTIVYSWDVNSTSTRRTIFANTFTVGQHSWRVKTYDASGLEGPWSEYEIFTAAEVPGAPTITSHANNSIIGDETQVVEWSASEQEAYQGQRVADNAGSIDINTVYWDSGIVESSSARSTIVEFPVNNRFEWIRWRIRNDGLWSPWAEIRVEVTYTKAPTPIISANTDSDRGFTLLYIQNPDSDPEINQPIVQYNSIRRRVIGDTDWAILVDEFPINSMFIDYQVASGVTYEYIVIAFAVNGTTTSSNMQTVTVYYNKWFIKDPDTSIDMMEVFVDGSSDLNITIHEDMAEFTALGRKDKVIIRDVVRLDEFSITIQTIGKEQREKLLDFINRQKTLLLQSPMRQWYFAFGKNTRQTVVNTIDDYQLFTIEVIEQADPFNV